MSVSPAHHLCAATLIIFVAPPCSSSSSRCCDHHILRAIAIIFIFTPSSAQASLRCHALKLHCPVVCSDAFRLSLFSNPLYLTPCILWHQIDPTIASWLAWRRWITTVRLTLRSNPSALIGFFNVAMLFSLGATPISCETSAGLSSLFHALFQVKLSRSPALIQVAPSRSRALFIALSWLPRRRGHALWFKSRCWGRVLCFVLRRRGRALSWLSRHWGRTLCFKLRHRGCLLCLSSRCQGHALSWFSRRRGLALCFKSRAHLPLRHHAFFFIIAAYRSSLHCKVKMKVKWVINENES